MAITELSSSTESPAASHVAYKHPVVDIVAVHGILEGAIDTWTHAETGVLWLRDLFPHERHNARILLYSYSAKAFLEPSDSNADRILPLANSLVAELCADRQLAGALKRPIIFICHGFGGLLVKRALAFSSSRRSQAVEHLRSVYISTYAIVFAGTPHNGVRKETLLMQHSNSLGPTQFVLNLLRGSEMLQEISDQFAPILKRFAVYNLWEQKRTPMGQTDSFVVEEDSAAPIWDNAERCGISATHMEMIKFSNLHHPGYRIILGALIRYTANAPAVIEYRWGQDVEALGNERRLEAENLLKAPLQYLGSDDDMKTNLNEYFIIPRCSITYFTGRKSHAGFVREKLGPVHPLGDANKHQICVIFGLGGAGKTQFCLRYAEDNKPRYWGVFWIDASSEDNAENSFASLGQQMGRGATFSGGMFWLSQCTKPWLLIIDNADDPEMDVLKYFPVGSRGHILITTRNPGAVIYATVGHLRFSGLEPDDAVNLLLKTAFPKSEPPSPHSGNRQTAQQITSELGYLALAIANAGTSIRRNIYTLEMYLRYYLGHRKNMILSKSISTADEANIITTWEIPFQKIASRNSLGHRDAVDLIHICAFLHFDSIPEAIFKNFWEAIKTVGHRGGSAELTEMSSEWDEVSQLRLRAALSTLHHYSIIDHDSKTGILSLHPVIQRWAKDRLPDVDRKFWLNIATAVLAQCISPHMEASGQRLRRSLLPHIEACLRALKMLHNSVSPETIERATEIERFAWVFAENGLWKRARSYQSDILKYRLKKLGRYNKQTIQAQRSLAQSDFLLFDLVPCISIQRQLLETSWYSRPSLIDWLIWPPWKPEHVAYCVALSDLTLSLWFAGKLEWSKRAGERAVIGLMKRLGPDDPLTLTAKFNLARTYHHLCDHCASRVLLVEVLRKRKRLFGLNHPDTLMVRNELGMSFCIAKEHLPAAERLVSNVLTARKKILGEEHAYTLWSMNDLARVLTTRHRPEEAIAILNQVIPILHRTLGDEHAGMSMTKANLTQAYVRAGRWKDAEILLKDVLQIVSRDHPDWIVAKLGYIRVLTATDRLEAAEADCMEVLDFIARERVVAVDSPRLLVLAEQLSIIYTKQERWEELRVLKMKYPLIDQPDRQQFNIRL